MPQSVPWVVSSRSSLRSTPPRPWVDATGLLLSLSCCSLLSLVCTVFDDVLNKYPSGLRPLFLSAPLLLPLPLALLSLGQWIWWSLELCSFSLFSFICLEVGWLTFLCLFKSSIHSNLLLLLVTLFFFYRISYLLLFKHCFLLIDISFNSLYSGSPPPPSKSDACSRIPPVGTWNWLLPDLPCT